MGLRGGRVELVSGRSDRTYTFMSLPPGNMSLFMCARDMYNMRTCKSQGVTIADLAVSEADLAAGADLLDLLKAAGDVEGTTVLAVQQAAVSRHTFSRA
eukprot:719620-Pyramimonas_sp.AAC.1